MRGGLPRVVAGFTRQQSLLATDRKCQLIQKRLEVARNRQFTAPASFSTSSWRQFSPRGRPPQEGEDGGGIQNSDLPELSDMAKRVAPNPYRSLRNAFFTHGIIRPYFDPGFDLNDFKAGARAAVQTVSKLLSQGDFDALEDLMEKTCFDDIKRRLSFTSAEQRSALKVCEDNIHTDFVYEVGIMFQEDQYETADRYVEITYVAHVVQAGMDKVMEQMDNVRSIKESMDVYSRSTPMVINYRFLRKYVRGQDPDTFDWTISGVNHFSISDPPKGF